MTLERTWRRSSVARPRKSNMCLAAQLELSEGWEGRSTKGNGIAKSKNPSLTRRGRVRSCWVGRKQGGSGHAKGCLCNKPRVVTFCRETLKGFEEASNRSCSL